jgi:hypothetical protein
MWPGMSAIRQVCWIGIAAATVLAGCHRGSDAARAAPGAAEPVIASRPAPPPDHPTELAAPLPIDAAAAEAAVQDSLSTMSKLGSEADSLLSEASFDGRAPSSLVVLAGGRQADAGRQQRERHERWEIRFAAGTSVEAYSRQLDSFKIELGVIGGQQQVTYLTNLSNPKPTSRTGNAADDARLYLIWQRGAIREVDELIASRAGVETAGKVIAHFLPKGVEDELSRLEDARAKQLGIARIDKTVFGITSSGQDSYRFTVLVLRAQPQ